MISVIIPLYNKEAIIERTLRSVLSQDYDDYEVVIVDDGSTDNSLAVVERELPKIKRELNVNTNVELIQQENGGPSKARNTGVKNAKGDWIVFLDADDELLPNALKKYSNLANNHHDADIIDCSISIRCNNKTSIIGHSSDGYSKNPMCDWFFKKIFPGCDHSLFRSSLLKDFKYDESIRRYEDAELLTRILKVARVFTSQEVTAIVNSEYSSASSARQNIMEDFLGHLDMSKGGFWYKMCVYKFFIEERENYPEQCRKLYPTWYWRYDLLLLMKLSKKMKFLFR